MQTHGLYLVDQENPYFQGRKIYYENVILHILNVTSKTLYALIVYVSTTNKGNSIDTTFRTV